MLIFKTFVYARFVFNKMLYLMDFLRPTKAFMNGPVFPPTEHVLERKRRPEGSTLLSAASCPSCQREETCSQADFAPAASIHISESSKEEAGGGRE